MTAPPQPTSHPIRALLKQSPLYAGFKQLGHYPDYWWWMLRGKPRRIPHLLKQRAVIEYALAFGLTTLVETGTYYGEMIAAVADRFRQIYSIEFDQRLAAMARSRFRRHAHVQIIESDSQSAVPWLLSQLAEPCLWWLDAGYCGWAGHAGPGDRLDTELNAILGDRIAGHVILMDDADGIVDEHGLPSVKELMASIEARHPERRVAVAHNILRIAPNRSGR